MAPSLDFEAMRRAMEESDYDALMALYADDAEFRSVNKKRHAEFTDGAARQRGDLRAAAGRLRAMTHHIEGEIVGENRVAFNEACEYPDGLKVLTATTLELQDGMIVRQTNVEAWDE